MSKFVHLHLHTQYSLLDGAIKISNLVKKASELGQQAIAMTDHGNMHGAIEFYNSAKSNALHPIIGCEMYVTAGSRHERKPLNQGGAKTHHLTLLAKNRTGYQNLCRLVTLGYQEGFYHKPRVDFELLSTFSEGLICLSGCVSSQLSSYAGSDDYKEALNFVQKYAGIFKNNYYLEIQPHQVFEQQKLNSCIRDLAKEAGLPIVATNDCHYISPDDKYAQEVLMCISTGKNVNDASRIKHDVANLHFKTAQEMLAELPDFSEAIKQSYEIAKSCELDFDFSTYYMPRYFPNKKKDLDPTKEDKQTKEFFKEKSLEGLEQRFKEFKKRNYKLSKAEENNYRERLELEIEIITKMGFCGYFLVVSDFILWAKNNDVSVGPGRGSAAGSLVAYALYITEIDPIPYKLLFERFLNPDRVSLPDIDVDFCMNGRDKVIEYVTQKYGKDKVAQILTFGTLKAKAAIKDVGRALGLSFAETDRIAKLVPAPRQGFDYPLADALKMEKRLKEYADGEGKELIDLAQKLEGLSRHTSTHAAGLVIADRPVVELLPLMLDKDGQVVTQFSMNWVEKIGLVKFDFLGLKTLTVLDTAVRMIKDTEGIDIELNALPLEDQRTYKLISASKTIGVFQLESSGITDMVGKLKPSRFEDIVAILALYRPGPLDSGMATHYIDRKHGREKVTYAHPSIEKILEPTYGIILYQEQIMQIAQVMAGYTLAEADMLRRAMGKKKPEEMAKQREIFISGSIKNKVEERIAQEVFDQMETFARYGFNKSHSVAYAMISFQTGYLKAHYPRQFMAALMSLEMGDTDKTLKNLNECREAKIEVLPPDINKGRVGFFVVNKQIIFGLAAIKGVGEKAIEKIIEERDKNGLYISFLDFCKRIDSSLLNKRLLENLIKSGAFDSFDLSRAELVGRIDDVIKRAQQIKEEKESNQLGLFAQVDDKDEEKYMPNRPLLPEWPVNMKLGYEREALGFYLSGHPLEKFKEELLRVGCRSISTLNKTLDGQKVKLAGVITFLKLKNTKKGDRYATFILEDLLGTIESIVWPDKYKTLYEILQSEDPVVVIGKLDFNDERRTLIIDEVHSAIEIRDTNAKFAKLQIDTRSCDKKTLSNVLDLVSQHSGSVPLSLIIRREDHSETLVSTQVSIEPSEFLCNKIEEILGKPSLSFY